MRCGNLHDGDTEHLDDAGFIAAWDGLRAWREANPVDRNDAQKVRNEVWNQIGPLLPTPRSTSSQWWRMMCILSGDMLVWQTLAETKWLVWAFYGAIPVDKRHGPRPVPGEDFPV